MVSKPLSALLCRQGLRAHVSRARVIHLEVTTPAFVVVATAIIQALVNIRRIDKENNRPNCEKKQGSSKQRADEYSQLSLPRGCLSNFVPLEHLEHLGTILI